MPQESKSIIELDEFSMFDCVEANDLLLLGSETEVPKAITIDNFASSQTINQLTYLMHDNFHINTNQIKNNETISRTYSYNNLLAQYSTIDIECQFFVELSNSEILDTDESRQTYRALPRTYFLKKINQQTLYALRYSGKSAYDISSSNNIQLTQLFLNGEFYFISCDLILSTNSISFNDIKYETSSNKTIDFALNTNASINISARI